MLNIEPIQRPNLYQLYEIEQEIKKTLFWRNILILGLFFVLGIQVGLNISHYLFVKSFGEIKIEENKL